MREEIPGIDRNCALKCDILKGFKPIFVKIVQKTILPYIFNIWIFNELHSNTAIIRSFIELDTAQFACCLELALFVYFKVKVS